MQSNFTAVHALDMMELFNSLSRMEAREQDTNVQVYEIMNSVQHQVLSEESLTAHR
jgi:hypothetical protein